MSNENDYNAYMQAYLNQYKRFQQPPQQNHGSTDQSPHLKNNDGIIDNFNNQSHDQTPDYIKNYVPPRTKTVKKEKVAPEGACPQCGTLHPPIPPGTKCPMAPTTIKGEDGVKILNTDKFIMSMKNILISQIEIKKIKDPEKLFNNITIEIMKYLESYEENK